MDRLRDLLTTAATDVGWDIDLDQLPVTCAQAPDGVLNLIDASAAHLAATASMSILDQAAASLRAVLDGTASADHDWEIRLLATVLHMTETLHRQTERTRRRLITALHALQVHGATWPPPTATTPADADRPTDLATALAEVGLHPQPDSGDPTRTTYQARRHERTITVTVYHPDGNTAELHVFDRHAALLWTATFPPGTPPAVLTAAVRDALPADPPTPASDPV